MVNIRLGYKVITVRCSELARERLNKLSLRLHISHHKILDEIIEKKFDEVFK